MSRVSLVTTVKNEAHSIRDLEDAIRRQTRRPDEWIIVDGGSTDGTCARLQAGDDPKILFERGNIARGRNRAITSAQGDLIIVTDSGCRPAPNWLERLIAPLEADQADITAGETCPRIRRPFDATQWTLLDQLYSPRWVWRRPTISSRSLAFRRQVWADCEYPEWLDIGEDRWLVDEWLRRGWRLEFIGDRDAAVEWSLRPGMLEFHRQHYRYMLGDGQADLRPVRNLLRLGFYGGLAGLLVLGAGGWAWGPWLASALWLAYLGATLMARFGGTVKGRPFRFKLNALLWTPPSLIAMDLAKIAGYLRGTLRRMGTRIPGEPRPRAAERDYEPLLDPLGASAEREARDPGLR